MRCILCNGHGLCTLARDTSTSFGISSHVFKPWFVSKAILAKQLAILL
ncbi:hypothetical protein Goarm_021498, partial [Gossypium armourianum]|nr:hypothetical protein [Gossypium armourianum]